MAASLIAFSIKDQRTARINLIMAKAVAMTTPCNHLCLWAYNSHLKPANYLAETLQGFDLGIPQYAGNIWSISNLVESRKLPHRYWIHSNKELRRKGCEFIVFDLEALVKQLENSKFDIDMHAKGHPVERLFESYADGVFCLQPGQLLNDVTVKGKQLFKRDIVTSNLLSPVVLPELIDRLQILQAAKMFVPPDSAEGKFINEAGLRKFKVEIVMGQLRLTSESYTNVCKSVYFSFDSLTLKMCDEGGERCAAFFRDSEFKPFQTEIKYCV